MKGSSSPKVISPQIVSTGGTTKYLVIFPPDGLENI